MYAIRSYYDGVDLLFRYLAGLSMRRARQGLVAELENALPIGADQEHAGIGSALFNGRQRPEDGWRLDSYNFV